MLNALRRICLGAILVLGPVGCGGSGDDETAYIPDLLLPPAPLPELQETLKAQAAEQARFIEDWRLHAAERGWERMQPSGRADREAADACRPSFEAHYAKRSAVLYEPGSLDVSTDSLRMGLLENGIRIGTVRAGLRGPGQPVHEEVIVFRLDNCDVIAARHVHDLVGLSVIADGPPAGEASDARQMALWLSEGAAPDVRINARQNAVAVYIREDLARADFHLRADDACSLARPGAAQAQADGPPTLDRLCPGASATVTPTLVESSLWLNLFGAGDMAAHMDSEDRPHTILVDAAKRPGLQAPYLLDVYVMTVPDPAATLQPRPEDLLFLYPLRALSAEKK